MEIVVDFFLVRVAVKLSIKREMKEKTEWGELNEIVQLVKKFEFHRQTRSFSRST